MNTRRTLAFAMIPVVVAAVVTSAAATARAQETTQADLGAQASLGASGRSGRAEGGFLIAGKVGGIIPVGGMSPYLAGALELGWMLKSRAVGLFLDVSYATPKADCEEQDARLPGGSFTCELTQKELVFQPTFQYRFGLASLTPYVGIGPRIYLLETVVRGESGDQKFEDTKERSTKFGVGLPLGVELPAGPGGLFAEVLLQWASMDHRTTGDTNLGAVDALVGYRAVL